MEDVDRIAVCGGEMPVLLFLNERGKHFETIAIGRARSGLCLEIAGYSV